MADDIRLYMFECGTLKCHVENIKMNQGLGEPFEIPVPWYLVCLLYTSPSPRDRTRTRMPSSA